MVANTKADRFERDMARALADARAGRRVRRVTVTMEFAEPEPTAVALAEDAGGNDFDTLLNRGKTVQRYTAKVDRERLAWRAIEALKTGTSSV